MFFANWMYIHTLYLIPRHFCMPSYFWKRGAELKCLFYFIFLSSVKAGNLCLVESKAWWRVLLKLDGLENDSSLLFKCFCDSFFFFLYFPIVWFSVCQAFCGTDKLLVLHWEYLSLSLSWWIVGWINQHFAASRCVNMSKKILLAAERVKEEGGNEMTNQSIYSLRIVVATAQIITVSFLILY